MTAPDTRLVLIVCPVCVTRYAGRVSAECGVCNGAGVVLVGAPAIAASDEWTAARAAAGFLTTYLWRDRSEQVTKRARAETAGLVQPHLAYAHASPDFRVPPREDAAVSPAARAAVGRRATALLEALGLRQKREKATREITVGRVRGEVGTVRTTVTETYPVAPPGTVDLAAARERRKPRR